MKERPILFKGAMVRAILEGRKTQTRRGIKKIDAPDKWIYKGLNYAGNHIFYPEGIERPHHKTCVNFPCPYGGPGDRLWVRETFALESNFNIECPYDPPHKDGRPINWEEDIDWGKWWEQPHYKATDPAPDLCYEDQAEDGPCVRWKPSIHMPRWASRITLEVIGIKVERLHKIKNKGALAEGVVQINRNFLMDPEVLKIPVKYSNGTFINDERYWGNDHPRGAFASYWDEINGPDSFKQNPWVWVVEFKEIKE